MLKQIKKGLLVRLDLPTSGMAEQAVIGT
jgi:hypothetical protein